MRKSLPKSYQYIEKLLPAETEMMLIARENSEKIGLEQISISTAEAQIIKFYLASLSARKVIEIGTLTGLSALHLLQILPQESLLITFEKSEIHAELAGRVLNSEIQSGRCRLIVGDARENLNEINDEGPFDAVFIDGNKSAYLEYYNWAVKNVREGGLIFVDNVFLGGAVWDEQTLQRFNSKQVESVHRMNLTAFSSPELISVIIPTQEGLLISRKIMN